ncbi:MAG TPA: SDR family NAD(P)-dependent oxidoreductase, partial [Gammaproteobacteria bacterium]|nr:SDR family NAD(P)-dependent oxidoreductase [Gammaproteobacteria bacterium]
MSEQPVIVIVGVGPGLGQSAAVRFAREGYRVALMARDPQHTAPAADAVRQTGAEALDLSADAADAQALAQAFGRVREQWGDPAVLVYNAGQFRPAGLLDMEPEVF